jgi:acyl carrier protein
MPGEIISRVIGVISATQHFPPGKATGESTFEELGLDSMDAVNILFALENEFDISIPDNEARGIRSIKEMAAGVERLVAAKAAKAAQAPG